MNAHAEPSAAAPVQGPLHRLPRESAARAGGRTRLLALLARARIEARGLAPAAERPVAPWPALRFELDTRYGRIGFVPMRDGAPSASLCSPEGTPDLSRAADALEAAEPTLLALESALGTAVSPVAMAPQPPGDRVEIEFALADGASARLDLPAVVLGRLPDPAWREPPLDVLRYALACRVMLGSTRLSHAAAAGLCAGDVVLPHDAFSRTPTIVLVAPDGGRASALFDASARTIRFGPPPSSEPSMPNDPVPDAAPTDGAPDWTRLPIELAFELPRVSVPLAVLAGMQPGAVIAVAPDLATLEVTIHNGGRAVGRGELIAVGDGLGIRLVVPLDRLR